MPKEETGVKPVEQTEVPPTSETTGEETVPPTEETPPIEDEVTEKDGDKVVPLSAHIAQREDYQKKIRELEEKMGTKGEQTQEQTAGSPDFNWDEILGLNKEKQPEPAPAQPKPDQLREINERIREMRENGDELGAAWLVGQFFSGQQENMRDAARKVVKDYDSLPLNTVTTREVEFFRQNPEALRGVLAKVKTTGQTTSSKKEEIKIGNKDGNWDEVLKQERKNAVEEYIKSMTSQSGISGEGARSDSTTPTEAFELDENGIKYMQRRGIPKEKWPLYAEQLKREQELEGRF